MKIPVSTFRGISILWALYFILEITVFIYAITKVDNLHLLAKLTLAATIVSGVLTILLFCINQFIFNAELKTLSNVSFILSAISLGGIVYWYIVLPIDKSHAIANAVFLGFHLLVFRKSNSYYNYCEAKKSGKLTSTYDTKTSEPEVRKTTREWIENFLSPPDHDNRIIDSPDFLKMNKDDDGVKKG